MPCVEPGQPKDEQDMHTYPKYSPPGQSRGDGRRTRRHRSKVEVVVEYQDRTIPGRLYDLSLSGMAINMHQAFFGPQGASVVVRAKEIGLIDGIVRWSRNNRIGVQFSQSSKSVAQVTAYFRFFHKDLTT